VARATARAERLERQLEHNSQSCRGWSHLRGSGTVEGRDGRHELGSIHWNSGSKAIGTGELRRKRVGSVE
jgi:hypothetical protein